MSEGLATLPVCPDDGETMLFSGMEAVPEASIPIESFTIHRVDDHGIPFTDHSEGPGLEFRPLRYLPRFECPTCCRSTSIDGDFDQAIVDDLLKLAGELT